MGRLNSVLKRKGVAFEKIKYLLATHYHPDHAGLAQEMKDRGVKLIVMDTQVDWMARLDNETEHHYHDISLVGASISRAAAVRISEVDRARQGDHLTPGHTEDSVT
jgi:glyoxylase-like metal-dependent hydrolase (beta-lactamase superfamily II)